MADSFAPLSQAARPYRRQPKTAAGTVRKLSVFLGGEIHGAGLCQKRTPSKALPLASRFGLLK
jgi:hypothetical protein